MDDLADEGLVQNFGKLDREGRVQVAHGLGPDLGVVHRECVLVVVMDAQDQRIWHIPVLKVEHDLLNLLRILDRRDVHVVHARSEATHDTGIADDTNDDHHVAHCHLDSARFWLDVLADP